MIRYIVTNGNFYVGLHKDTIVKVLEYSKARMFKNADKCINVIKSTPFCDTGWFYKIIDIPEPEINPIIKKYVITDGDCYYKTRSGMIIKTHNICESFHFDKQEDALTVIYENNLHKMGFYIKEVIKRKRKGFPESVQKIIYKESDGHCKLCGRKIMFDDMTIDHIIPLAMNGSNEIDNLQCTCKFCNSAKASILPEDFFDRIASIFMYQMEKKYADRLSWKLVKCILRLKYSL